MNSNIPFASLIAKASFKGGGVTSIDSDEFFSQNGVRDLQRFFEQGEAPMIDRYMQKLSEYASIRDSFNREIKKPEIDLIEKNLIEIIERLKQRKIDTERNEAELSAERERWAIEAKPFSDAVLEQIENLKSSIKALEDKCRTMKFDKGNGYARRFEVANSESYIRKSGYVGLKRALDQIGNLY